MHHNSSHALLAIAATDKHSQGAAHLSLSNPNSVRNSPLAVRNTRTSTIMNSMFSPPTMRRSTPQNIPSRLTTNEYNHGGQQAQTSGMSSSWGGFGGGPSQVQALHIHTQQQTRSTNNTPAFYDETPAIHNNTRRSQSGGLNRPILHRQHRSLDASDVYAVMEGYGQGQQHPQNVHPQQIPPSGLSSSNYLHNQQQHHQGPSNYLQTAGTTDFPVYPSTSMSSYAQSNLPRFPQQQPSSSYAMPPYTSAPTSQPLAVSTDRLGYNAGPMSGPGAYGNSALSAYNQQQQSTSSGLWSSNQMAPPPPSQQPTATHLLTRDPYSMPMPTLQREYDLLRREFEASVQKLNSTMNSIKTFWSPELKRERAMRKEEQQKMQMIENQLRISQAENQKSVATLRQMQNELQSQFDMHRTFGAPSNAQVLGSGPELDALRMDRDRLQRENQLMKENGRELQAQIDSHRQTLNSRDEALRKLHEMLQAKGMVPHNAYQERLELEQARQRVNELEGRSRQMESVLSMKEHDIRALQEECMAASEKLRQSQWAQKSPSNQYGDDSAMQGLLETKVGENRIKQLEKSLQFFEDETRTLRDQLASQPREFTDKTVSVTEYQEVKLKMEKAELELQTKVSELQASHTRLMTVEDQLRDIKKHHTIMKESVNAKEHQLQLMQSDIEALRGKLEAKNETIEHRAGQVTQMQADTSKAKGEVSDLKEQLKIKDQKMQILQRKVEGLEELVREKDTSMKDMRQQVQALPAMQQQTHLQEQIEELLRERDRHVREVNELRDGGAQERVEQQDVHRQEVREMRLAIDSLQKEIADRQVLIESQNENISDLNRELSKCRRQLRSENLSGAERSEVERLRDELHEAREEVNKLLTMVREMEREKSHLNTRLKDAHRALDDNKRGSGGTAGRSSYTTMESSNTTYKRAQDEHLIKQKDQRIEELEEALRESVSITAERELSIVQQKNATSQNDMRTKAYQDQLTQMQGTYTELQQRLVHAEQTTQDKDAIIRALRRERHKLLEDYLQLKQDYLQSSISEKDARVALLEMTNRNPDEMHALKRQREKLMRKLKDEEDRRIRLLADSKTELGDVGSLMNEMKSPMDGDDDAEGIWA